MRVDLLSNIASASDAPVKTAEDAEKGSAGNFFAEIGRALNADEPEGKSTGKKGSDQNSDEQDGNDLSLFMSACLFALQPLNQDLGLDPTLTDSKGESAETSNTAISNEQMSAGAVKADSDEKGKRTDLKSNLDLFDRTIYSLLSVQNPGIQNAETDALDRNAALNGIALQTKNTVPDKLTAAENIAQGNISPDLQTINASGGSMPFEFSKTVETQVIEASEKTSVQPKLSGTEALLENVSKDTAVFQMESNKLELEGENSPAAQSQLRFPETASHERFIPVDKTNPTGKRTRSMMSLRV